MHWLLVVFLLIALPVVSQAEYFVCGNGVRPQCAGTTGLTNILPSIDPSHVTDPTCVAVPEEQLDAQKTLIQTVIEAHANGRCHLKLVGGLAVEMTQGEKDAVNAALQALVDAYQAFVAEIATQDTCGGASTLDELNTILATRKATKESQIATATSTLQAQIDALAAANLTTLKAGLTAVNNAIADAATFMLDEEYFLVQRLARCILARAKVR